MSDFEECHSHCPDGRRSDRRRHHLRSRAAPNRLRGSSSRNRATDQAGGPEATTNGVRPLTYRSRSPPTAASAGRYSAGQSCPGDGKTSVVIDRLEIGKTYYWRAWAADGANTGDKVSAGFEIFPKATVAPPSPASPINNETVGSVTPTIVARNASTAGPVGYLAYEFQVASDQAFGHLIAAGIVNEGSGQTTFNSSPLGSAATYFWRVRAGDNETMSGWSPVQAFRTPNAPPPPPPPPPPGTGGGSCASKDGNAIIRCISAKYPDRLVAGVSLGTRQANMSFLRDRIIESGRCAGLDLAWNLKRGGPEVSIDFISEKVNGQVIGHDIAFDYDKTSTPLQLYWGGGDFPAYGGYTNSFSCGG